MSADPNAKAPSAPMQASQEVSPPKLFSAWHALFLTLGWFAIGLLYAAMAQSHPREFESPFREVVGALFLAYPLAWSGYSAWRNRDRFRAWTPTKRLLHGARVLLQPLYWAAGILIPVALVAAVTVPAYSDYTVRAKLSELILAASGFRASVTKQAQANKALAESGADLVVLKAGKVTDGLVARDGVILIYNDEFRALVAMVPEMKGTDVKWSCDGMPRKYFPSSCGKGQPETSYIQRRSGSTKEDAVELLRRGADWQAQVAGTASARASLAGSAKTTIVRREGLLDFGLLDSNGRIALFSDRHGTFVLLEPTLNDAKVTWRCRVWPAKAAPAGCDPSTPLPSR